MRRKFVKYRLGFPDPPQAIGEISRTHQNRVVSNRNMGYRKPGGRRKSSRGIWRYSTMGENSGWLGGAWAVRVRQMYTISNKKVRPTTPPLESISDTRASNETRDPHMVILASDKASQEFRDPTRWLVLAYDSMNLSLCSKGEPKSAPRCAVTYFQP